MPANRFAGKYKGGDRIALCIKNEASGKTTKSWKAWWGTGKERSFTSFAVKKYGYYTAKRLAQQSALAERRMI